MFHVAGFFLPVSAAPAASTTTILPAVFDGYLRVTDQRITVPRPLKLYWGYVFHPDSRAAFVESDALREIGPHYLVPPTQYNDSLDISDIVLPPVDRMLEFVPPKEYGVKTVTGTTANGGSIAAAFLWLGDGNYQAPVGKTWTIKFRFSEDQPPGKWHTALLSPQDILPHGTYAVVGGMIAPANQDVCIIAWRLRFQNQDWMPGGMAQEFPGDPMPKVFRMGRLGLWGTFTESSIPEIQYQTFMAAGTLVADVYLDVVKIR